MKLKPSELIPVLQEAIDKGIDDEVEIVFDTEARNFEYHIAVIGSAAFEDGTEAGLGKYIVLSEDRL